MDGYSTKNNKDYYYKVLGVKPDASQDAITKAYKTIAKEYHPDKYRNNPLQHLVEEKLREANEAYEILGNPEKRKNYDQDLSTRNQASNGQSDIIIHLRKAEDFLERRLFDSARTEYEKALTLDSNIPDAYFGIGISYELQEKFDAAISSFEKVLKIEPNSHIVYNLIGSCYLRQNNFDRALHYCQKASQLLPNEALYLENIAHCHWAAKNIEDALIYFRKALKLTPDSAAINMYVCHISAENGWIENAKRYYEIAKKVDPNHPLVKEWAELNMSDALEYSALLQKGVELFTMNQFENAIIELKKVLDINPNVIDAYIGIGLCYKGQSRFNNAIESFQKAIQIAPTNPGVHEVYNYIGLCYLEQNRFDEAIEYFNKALQIDVNNPIYLENIALVYNNKGVMLNDSGKYDEALSYFEQSLRFSPHNTMALNNKQNTLNNKNSTG
ncbi:MAG TPA: tetratricopeptide repeat protein, partial [Candidatus Syntrophosphaera thermopropionivorans]|nr:tetratricopeptide repeat protein [Candidatus Syntrophosphaera thermopropionivorans]